MSGSALELFWAVVLHGFQQDIAHPVRRLCGTDGLNEQAETDHHEITGEIEEHIGMAIGKVLRYELGRPQNKQGSQKTKLKTN